MIGFGGMGGRRRGTWYDGAHWVCGCHQTDNIRSDSMPDCYGCGYLRASTPSPRTENDEYGSYHEMSLSERRRREARLARAAELNSAHQQAIDDRRTQQRPTMFNTPPRHSAAQPSRGSLLSRAPYCSPPPTAAAAGQYYSPAPPDARRYIRRDEAASGSSSARGAAAAAAPTRYHSAAGSYYSAEAAAVADAAYRRGMEAAAAAYRQAEEAEARQRGAAAAASYQGAAAAGSYTDARAARWTPPPHQSPRENSMEVILRALGVSPGGGVSSAQQGDAPDSPLIEDMRDRYDAFARREQGLFMRASPPQRNDFEEDRKGPGAGAQGAAAAAAAHPPPRWPDLTPLYRMRGTRLLSAIPLRMRALRQREWDAARRGEVDGPTIRHLERTANPYPYGWPGHPDDTDCRGVASVEDPEMIPYKAYRVEARKEGYCRRQTCECCAPQPDRDERGGNYCSCHAVADGLCRRCWLDYHRGIWEQHNEYWGP